MIRTFKSKALAELWETEGTRGLDAQLKSRILRRLDVLDQALSPDDMNQPGFNFHELKGHKPPRYTVHINGPWCITFEFDGEDALRVDLEQYH